MFNILISDGNVSTVSRGNFCPLGCNFGQPKKTELVDALEVDNWTGVVSNVNYFGASSRVIMYVIQFCVRWCY